MRESALELVEMVLKLRSDRRIAELVELYSTDAVIARHEGTASGHAEIRSFLAGFLASHGRFDVVSVDSFTECDDLILFDATVETSIGLLQTVEMMVLDDNGLIRRHVPGLRGYWGQ